MMWIKHAWMTGILIATAFAGCFGDDGGTEEEESPTGTTGGTGGGNGTRDVTVEITSYPPTVNSTTDGIGVDWTVITDGNVTLDITSTAVYWSNQSVASPGSPSEYGGNTSGQQVGTTPGNFTANFTVEDPGMYYVRAHASVEGVDYWSDEVTIEVGGGGANATTVTIRSALLGQLSGFDPDEVTISVGGSIVWDNADDEAHTATATDNSFDTGDVAGGSQSQAIRFDTAGEFEYRCSRHPQTMMGTIIVEA